jgi:hypothetical protein
LSSRLEREEKRWRDGWRRRQAALRGRRADAGESPSALRPLPVAHDGAGSDARQRPSRHRRRELRGRAGRAVGKWATAQRHQRGM